MRTVPVVCRCYLGLVLFCLAGSLLSRLSGLNPGPIQPVASVLTVATGFIAVFEPVLKNRGKRDFWILGCGLICACAVEICGLFVGLPFGRYEYTTRWQPLIRIGTSWFPGLLPFAWLLVVGACTIVCSSRRLPILQAACLATACDFIMEPVMAGSLGYWHWEERGPMPGGASALNPLGWFLTSLGVGFLLSKLSVGNARVAATVLSGHIGLTLGIGAIALIPR